MTPIHALLLVLLLVLSAPVDAATGHGTAPTTREEVRRMVVQEALRGDRVPPSLALAVAHAESYFDPDAESSAGARGVMQIMPATGRGEFGVSPNELWEPRLNIQLGLTFLGDLIDRYDGRWDLALSYYNGGSRVGSGATAKVIPVTQAYVDKVLKLERRYARDAETGLLIAEARSANPVLPESASRAGRERTLEALRAETRGAMLRAAERVSWLERERQAPGRDVRDHARFPNLPVSVDLGDDGAPDAWRPVGWQDRLHDRRTRVRSDLQSFDADRWTLGDRARRGGPGLSGRVGGSSGLLNEIETRKSRFRSLLRGS